MTAINDHLVLISGTSGTGKSASLMNLRDPEGVMYLNCEAGKKLPFANKFKTGIITDPYQVYDSFDHAKDNPNYHTIVVDTLTFLMDMYESQFVLGTKNTMEGWSNYAQYFKKLMQDKVANSDKNVMFLAHTLPILNENEMIMETKVPVKGSLKNQGIEAYFSTVVSTKKVAINVLENYQSDMLNITDQERMLGFKYVFQTQLTKDTVGDRIRSPMGLFTQQQTYIDNDAQKLMDHLTHYYQ